MFLTLSTTRRGEAHLLVAGDFKYSMQGLILYNTLPIAVHTSLTLKSNTFLYRSTQVLAIAQKYRVFSMDTSNDKAGYIVKFWFGLTA